MIWSILMLIVTMSFVMTSCGTKTNDDIIKTAFNNYVELNFDDPSLIKEVVSVTYGDTLTNQSFAEMIVELSQMSDSLEHVNKALTDKANTFATKYGHKVRNNQSFLKVWKEYEESLKNSIEKRWMFASSIISNDFIPIDKDSILKHQDFALLSFTIKYRVIERQEIKLKEKQGYFDLKMSKVYFEESGNNNMLSFLKGILKTMDYYKSMVEINSDVIEKAQKVISYLNH